VLPTTKISNARKNSHLAAQSGMMTIDQPEFWLAATGTVAVSFTTEAMT
jgi:hypothetical protein